MIKEVKLLLLLWFMVTLIVSNFVDPVKSYAIDETPFNPYDVHPFMPKRSSYGYNGPMVNRNNNDLLFESKGKIYPVNDENDDQDECYRTECNTDTFRVMKALSVRPEALVYCKNNQRCDCCVRPGLTKYEEDLLIQQIVQENQRLGID